MNFQEKMFETTAQLRARAAWHRRRRPPLAPDRRQARRSLKGSLATLTVAGRELNKVARRHASAS